MATQVRDLVISYISAVGEHRLDRLPDMLDPDVDFTFGDTQVRGVDAFVGAFERISQIILRNDIRKVFVDGDEACVIYDFVTDTPVGAVTSVEYIKVKSGRIGSVLLVFERLHWPEVQAILAERASPPASRASETP
jgi:hypothetical protein